MNKLSLKSWIFSCLLNATSVILFPPLQEFSPLGFPLRRRLLRDLWALASPGPPSWATEVGTPSAFLCSASSSISMRWVSLGRWPDSICMFLFFPPTQEALILPTSMEEVAGAIMTTSVVREATQENPATGEFRQVPQ